MNKTTGFATALLMVASTAAAHSADIAPRPLPAKAPILQVYDWTGIYAGVNAGVGVGRDRFDTSVTAGGIAALERAHLSPFGAIGGAQIGYNYQFRNFYNLVLGVEADIQASGQRDRATCTLSCLAVQSNRFNREIDWFGTVRARAGIAKGPVLSYVTGGFAYGHVEQTSAGIVGGVPFSITGDQTRAGYVYGSGIEASLGGNWTAKLEYLRLFLGSRSQGFGPLGGVTLTQRTETHDNIFRAGLNYRFGGNNSYAAIPANWGGFYAGGNFGSALSRNRSSLVLGAPVPAPNGNTLALMPRGYLGGGQAGYNWQAGAWVFGVEADAQGAFGKDTVCVGPCSGGGFINIEQKQSYLATARGRVGYSVGSSLFYVTGGYAYGSVKTSFTETVGGLAGAAQIKSSNGGYAVGGGIESPFNPLGLFGPNWTSKKEYLYVDLGRSTNTFTASGVVQTFSAKTEQHIFRTGINYHFNTPVVAKY